MGNTAGVGVGLNRTIKTRPEYVPAQAQASYTPLSLLSFQLPPSAATITFDLTLACSCSFSRSSLLEPSVRLDPVR